ncbi:hypothetical protein [Aestuariivirga sp.]|uniref:hypothetical protein n=1 Tax=Aestuariivirga sp. TaxID=2650926 RepID=UPI003BA85FB4
MFSLNFDPLFLSLERVKAAAKTLNATWQRPPSEADPRELQRMQDELRAARERIRMQVTGGRLLW